MSKWDWYGGEWWKMRNRRDITMEQFLRLRERLTLARAVVPVANAGGRVASERYLPEQRSEPQAMKNGPSRCCSSS